MEQPSIKGTIEVIQEKQTFPSGFVKQIVVVNTGGEWPQQIPVEFVKEKTDLLSVLTQGQQVEVFYNLRGNEYNGKYYANIQGWRIDTGSQEQPPAQAAPVQHAKAAPTQVVTDEIPF